MVASRETLQDLAAERQLQPATLERVIRLIDILDAFGADPPIGPRVALKGGTALNVFHSDLDRLSVDIDVNYVGAVEKEQMDADRPVLEDRIAPPFNRSSRPTAPVPIPEATTLTQIYVHHCTQHRNCHYLLRWST
jgi:hypothetical protein